MRRRFIVDGAQDRAQLRLAVQEVPKLLVNQSLVDALGEGGRHQESRARARFDVKHTRRLPRLRSMD